MRLVCSIQPVFQSYQKHPTCCSIFVQLQLFSFIFCAELFSFFSSFWLLQLMFPGFLSENLQQWVQYRNTKSNPSMVIPFDVSVHLLHTLIILSHVHVKSHPLFLKLEMFIYLFLISSNLTLCGFYTWFVVCCMQMRMEVQRQHACRL